MKTLIAFLFLAGSVSACPPLGVCSQAVAVHQQAVVQTLGVQAYAAPVAVQSFAVQSYAVVPQAVQVQTFAYAVPQAVVVQQHAVCAQNVHVRNVRQPRQVVWTRTHTFVRSR